MAAADYRLLTEATGVRIAEALEDVTAMVGPKGDPGDVSEAELTAKLADKASAIVDTASGAIASFPDGAAVPAKDITIGIEPVQSGSGDPSPTNVRPISGWTGANVTRTGKNLLKITAQSTTIKDVTFTVNNDGTVTAVGTATGGSAFLNLGTVKLLAGTYILSGDTDGERSKTNFYIQRPGETHDYSLPFTLTEEKEFNAYIAVFNGNTADQIFYPQIEFGSTATAYEPYTGTSYPISWQSEAGTVYGGTLDVTTGVLTVTMAEVDLGTLGYEKYGSDGRFYSLSLKNVVKHGSESEGYANAFASIYKAVNSSRLDSLVDMSISIDVNGILQLYDSRYASSTASEYKAALSGVQLCYKLATPQTYQLAPTEVEMLLGDNNVWADIGDSTVAYRADTKLYIQKINAPTDDDMIADAQIASGRYFIVGGNLYKSTTTIPAGDAINPGSNCILTNLADALNALNT